jgi:hypothetical protein
MHFRQTVLTHVRLTPIALKNSLATAPRHRFNFLSKSGVLAMMGERTVMQESLFYGFSLERHVPSDHMPRKIDRFSTCQGRGRTGSAFAPSGGFATRFTSIWPIAGSAGSTTAIFFDKGSKRLWRQSSGP